MLLILSRAFAYSLSSPSLHSPPIPSCTTPRSPLALPSGNTNTISFLLSQDKANPHACLCLVSQPLLRVSVFPQLAFFFCVLSAETVISSRHILAPASSDSFSEAKRSNTGITQDTSKLWLITFCLHQFVINLTELRDSLLLPSEAFKKRSRRRRYIKYISLEYKWLMCHLRLAYVYKLVLKF